MLLFTSGYSSEESSDSDSSSSFSSSSFKTANEISEESDDSIINDSNSETMIKPQTRDITPVTMRRRTAPEMGTRNRRHNNSNDQETHKRRTLHNSHPKPVSADILQYVTENRDTRLPDSARRIQQQRPRKRPPPLWQSEESPRGEEKVEDGGEGGHVQEDEDDDDDEENGDSGEVCSVWPVDVYRDIVEQEYSKVFSVGG